jgi:hypothetical protein
MKEKELNYLEKFITHLDKREIKNIEVSITFSLENILRAEL